METKIVCSFVTVLFIYVSLHVLFTNLTEMKFDDDDERESSHTETAWIGRTLQVTFMLCVDLELKDEGLKMQSFNSLSLSVLSLIGNLSSLMNKWTFPSASLPKIKQVKQPNFHLLFHPFLQSSYRKHVTMERNDCQSSLSLHVKQKRSFARSPLLCFGFVSNSAIARVLMGFKLSSLAFFFGVHAHSLSVAVQVSSCQVAWTFLIWFVFYFAFTF